MKPIALLGNGPALRRTAGLLGQLGTPVEFVAAPEDAVDRRLEELARAGGHDVLVVDASSMSEPDHDMDTLSRCVEEWDHDAGLVVMADFGRSSELHGWTVDHVGLQAAGLWATVTGARDRPPLPTRSTVLESLVAYSLTSAIQLLRIGRRSGGSVAPVWLSRLEVALSCQPYFDLRYRYSARDSARTGMPFPMMLCPAREGFLGVNVLTDDQWYLLCALADRGDLLADDRFETPGDRLVSGEVLTDEFRAWAATVDAEPTFHRAQEMRVPLGYLPTLDELRTRLTELRAEVDHAPEDADAVVRIGVRRHEVASPDAPDFAGGERRDDGPWSQFDAVAPGVGPLAGLRVVDLSMFWAGPLATLFLALYGATVVKVESPTRLDGWRGLAGADSVEASHLFNGVNVNKLDVSLNLKDPESRARIDELVAGADVLVDNYSPGVLDRFGLDDEHLRGLNPRLVHLSMPAFGSAGDWRDYVGFAPTIEQLSGLPHLTRHDPADEPRLLGNSVADPAGGWGGIAAVLTELVHEPDRRGFVRLDLSQHRSLQGMLAPDLEALGSSPGKEFELIHCVDADADRDDAWAVVSFVPGRSSQELADWIDERPAPWRIAPSPEADEVAVHRYDGDMWAAARELQSAGFSAMPILHAADLVASGDRLGRSEYLAQLDKDEVGRSVYAGLPLELVGADAGMRWPGPTLGEHNHLITPSDPSARTP